MNWETLLCLGDSITIGSRSYLGYAEYCGNILEAKTQKQWNVINNATAGFKAIDLARDITGKHSNLKMQGPGVISLLIGTNDLKCNTPSEDFGIAYKQIVIKALLMVPGRNMILLHIPYLGRGIMLPYNYAMNELIDEYNAVADRIALQFGLDTLTIEVADEHYYDGVHLNREGSIHVAGQLSARILKARGL